MSQERPTHVEEIVDAVFVPRPKPKMSSNPPSPPPPPPPLRLEVVPKEEVTCTPGGPAPAAPTPLVLLTSPPPVAIVPKKGSLTSAAPGAPTTPLCNEGTAHDETKRTHCKDVEETWTRNDAGGVPRDAKESPALTSSRSAWLAPEGRGEHLSPSVQQVRLVASRREYL